MSGRRVSGQERCCPQVLLPKSRGWGIVWEQPQTHREKKRVMSGQRRSKRLPLHVHVHVYGRTPTNNPFRDVTRTISVDAHGARLALSADVKKGQSLLLVHSLTQEERECRVVHVGPEKNGSRRIGVEFVRPSPDFWHVYQPLVTLKQAGD